MFIECYSNLLDRFFLGVVYVIGGLDAHYEATNNVQGYRLRLNENLENRLEALQVPPMLDRRYHAGVTQCESGIVVCGGRNNGILNTCEIYDKSANA